MSVDVDVVIAVHDLRRPIARAVASVLEGSSGVRVTVACHGLDPDTVAALLPQRLRPAVRLLEVPQGMGEPAVPFNTGLAAATGRYVAIMGSDDLLEPGAVGEWGRRADGWGSDMVLAPLRLQDGTGVRTPRRRPGRTRRLDLVADRLAYRTAPLGLMRRATVERLGLRLTPGLRTGEDLAFTARLWAADVRVDAPEGVPAYVVGTDTKNRVTGETRPLAEELAAVARVRDEPWLSDLPVARRRALAIKVLRVHLLGAARRRREPGSWSADEPALLGALTRSWVAAAPGVLRPFSAADRRLLDVILDDADPEVLATAVRARPGRLDAVLSPRPADNLDRESTLRYLLADRVRRR